MKTKLIIISLAIVLCTALTTRNASARSIEKLSQMPALDITPGSLDFGRQVVGTTSSPQTITITNNDATDLTIYTLSIVGEFTLNNDTCSGQIIATGGTCAFDIIFSPLSIGTKIGSITIPSDSAASPDSIGLNGIGAENTWYVITTTGDDAANDCLTPSTPCLTINGAIGKAASDGIVKVATGIYAETVTISNKNINLLGGWSNGFTEQNGYSTIDLGGTTIWGENGIQTNSDVTISNFLIQNCYFGINHYGGELIFKNGALVNNKGGLYNYEGETTFINTTISGNGGGSYGGSAIINIAGNINIQYSTITNNGGGAGYAIDNLSSSYITIGSSIFALNVDKDCDINSNRMFSTGNNIFGSSPACSMNFTTLPTDFVGVNPQLTFLSADGYHALKATSPAVDNGDPSNCPPTDQRGVARPADRIGCDIGAYEGFVTAVKSVKPSDPNPTSASIIHFAVIFSDSVTGVDTNSPFDDFSLTATGVKDAFITAVNGSDDTYYVTVNVGDGNGYVRLNVLDNDSIIDTSTNPLGGQGVGNGNFMTGEQYAIQRIPTPKSPAGTIAEAKPAYKWAKIPGATKYRYQVLKGTSLVFEKIVNSSVCGSKICSDTSTTMLRNAVYKWKVQAMINGQWKDYSSFLTFTVAVSYPPSPGFWKGSSPEYSEFYVTTDSKFIDEFAIYVTVYDCNIYNQKLTFKSRVPIENNRFAHFGQYYFSGIFTSRTKANGKFGLDAYWWPGCGSIHGGPFLWNNSWTNSTQPLILDVETTEITLSSVLDVPLELFYHFDLVKP